jgi:hypothetical protein
MSNISETTRCPCGSDEQLRILTRAKRMKAWVECNDCSAWQHPICVGLLEDGRYMPKDYFCEECKPQHHGRFEFGPGLDDPDNREVIVKERQKMHVNSRSGNGYTEEIAWTIDEIMAIVGGHSASLAASWTSISGLSEDLRKEESFDRMLILSIRIVLRSAEIISLLAFREKLNKVRFSEGNVVAKQVWTLRKWLTTQFTTKIENRDMKQLLEESFKEKKWQGVEGMGEANATLVRKYFNL